MYTLCVHANAGNIILSIVLRVHCAVLGAELLATAVAHSSLSEMENELETTASCASACTGAVRKETARLCVRSSIGNEAQTQHIL